MPLICIRLNDPWHDRHMLLSQDIYPYLLLYKGNSAEPICDAQADVSRDLVAQYGQIAFDDGHARADDHGLASNCALLAQSLLQLLQLCLDCIALVPGRSKGIYTPQSATDEIDCSTVAA